MTTDRDELIQEMLDWIMGDPDNVSYYVHALLLDLSNKQIREYANEWGFDIDG